MLSCIRRPTINYDLAALCEDSSVSVGRETDAHIQLDSQDIPCLLSRKHAQLLMQPGGTFTLVDLGSTNGTFAARQNHPLRKLPPGYAWELQHGDTVGFGGPETIIVRRAQVGNPFLFKFYMPSGWQQPPAAPPTEPQHQLATLPPLPAPSTAPPLGPAPQLLVPPSAAAEDGIHLMDTDDHVGPPGPPQQVPGAPAGPSSRDASVLQALAHPHLHLHQQGHQRHDGPLPDEDDAGKAGSRCSPATGHPMGAAATLARNSAASVAQQGEGGAHTMVADPGSTMRMPASVWGSPSGGRRPHAQQQQQQRGAGGGAGKENAPGAQHPPHAGAAARVGGGGPQVPHAHAAGPVTPRSRQRQAQLAERVHTHLTCPVCCDLLVSTHMLHCGHMFCGLCLATWITHNQTCPSCRKPITGVPVRCFTIDNMITELLVNGGPPAPPASAATVLLSPNTRRERVRKQEHWDNIQRLIVQDWVTALQRRRDAAQQEAARHNQQLQQPAAGVVPVLQPQQLLQPAGPSEPMAQGVVQGMLMALGVAQDAGGRQ